MKILLLDIETAPHVAYVWGLYPDGISPDQLKEAGYILCWSAKWLDENPVRAYSMQAEGMLKEIHKLLDEADVVVTYNGKRFDIPTLNGAFISAGMKPPSGYKQVDLYQTVKRNFRFPSNKLDYVVKHFKLGAKKKHRGMPMWIDCMRGDLDAMAEMLEYNMEDVRITEALYKKLLPWITNHPNQGLYADNPDACPNCGGIHLTRRGYAYTAMGKFHRYRCKDCGTWSRSRKGVGVKNGFVQER